MSENKLKVSRNNTFTFEGRAIISDKTFTINSTNKDGSWVHNGLNLGIDCGEHGINYVNCMGGYSTEKDNFIYLQLIGEDGKFLSGSESTKIVKWDDRFDLSDDELKIVNPQNIIRTYLEKGSDGKNLKRSFISMYDAIAYIKDHLNDKDPVIINGHIEYRPSEDGNDWYTTHVLDSISLRNEELLQPKATLELMVLIDEKCVGQPNIEERNIPLYFKTLTYLRTINGNKYNQVCTVPVKVLLDMNTFDLSNEPGQKKFKYAIKNYFSSKDGFVNELLIRGYYTGGAKKVEVSLDDLPKDIREAIENGIMDKEQVIGAMAINGTAQKNIVFLQVPTFPKKVVIDDVEQVLPVPIHNKEKYKIDELLSFEDLEPIEVNNSNSTTAPVDNSVEIDSEEEDASLESIMNLFAKS